VLVAAGSDELVPPVATRLCGNVQAGDTHGRWCVMDVDGERSSLIDCCSSDRAECRASGTDVLRLSKDGQRIYGNSTRDEMDVVSRVMF